jgi:hypothetical protein
MEVSRLRYLFGDVFKISAAVVAVGLLLLLVYSFLTRDNDVYGDFPKPYFQNALTREVTWNTNNLTLENIAQEAVFKVKKRSLSREEAWDLAGKLSLPKGGQVTDDKIKGEQFSSTTPERELIVGLESGEVHFKNSQAIIATPKDKKINKSQALQTAKNQIRTLGINTSLINLEKPEYSYLQTGNSSHLFDAQEKDANIVYVAFPREIEGVGFAVPGGKDVLSVGLNSNNETISLNYNILEIEDQEARYKLVSEGSAKNKIKKRQGYLNRYLIDAEEAAANPSVISVGKGELYFYNDKQGDYITPIYVFRGSGLTDKTNEELEIYLPALKDNYFKK